MTNKIALDTNVLIYLHDNSDLNKRAIAKDLLSDNPFISSQVISEYHPKAASAFERRTVGSGFKSIGWVYHCPGFTKYFIRGLNTCKKV